MTDLELRESVVKAIGIYLSKGTETKLMNGDQVDKMLALIQAEREAEGRAVSEDIKCNLVDGSGVRYTLNSRQIIMVNRYIATRYKPEQPN